MGSRALMKAPEDFSSSVDQLVNVLFRLCPMRHVLENRGNVTPLSDPHPRGTVLMGQWLGVGSSHAARPPLLLAAMVHASDVMGASPVHSTPGNTMPTSVPPTPQPPAHFKGRGDDA